MTTVDVALGCEGNAQCFPPEFDCKRTRRACFSLGHTMFPKTCSPSSAVPVYLQSTEKTLGPVSVTSSVLWLHRAVSTSQTVQTEWTQGRSANSLSFTASDIELNHGFLMRFDHRSDLSTAFNSRRQLTKVSCTVLILSRMHRVLVEIPRDRIFTMLFRKLELYTVSLFPHATC